jgi:hypothetical protein
MVVVDIWGGKLHQDHIARYVLDTNEAIPLVMHELDSGNLVNLRRDVAWGPEQNFDLRLTKEAV